MDSYINLLACIAIGLVVGFAVRGVLQRLEATAPRRKAKLAAKLIADLAGTRSGMTEEQVAEAAKLAKAMKDLQAQTAKLPATPAAEG